MDYKALFSSKSFSLTVKVLGAVIVLLLVFQLGVIVGFRKASFSYRWGDNYHRAFGGPQGGFMRDFEGRDFFSGHGIAGIIARIDGNTIILRGIDGVERLINVASGTPIRQGIANLTVSDLKTDERIVVIGAPRDDGSIEAKIIRVFGRGSFTPPSAPVTPGPNLDQLQP